MQEEGKGDYFFKGKYFDTFDELLEYEKVWNKLQVTQESAGRAISIMKNDMICNLMIRDCPLNNLDLIKIIEKMYLVFCEEVMKKDPSEVRMNQDRSNLEYFENLRFIDDEGNPL